MKSEVLEFMCAIGTPPAIIGSREELPELKQSMLARIRWHKEELKELEDALNAEDWEEVLDAVVDMAYFQTQDVIELEYAGFDVVKAKELVCINNASKYSSSYDYICNQFQKIDDPYLSICSQRVGDTWFHCLKDGRGKVKKPADFVPVDLSECLPEYLKPELVEVRENGVE